MIDSDKPPDEVFRAMVADLVEAFPAIGEALAVGGQHAQEVLDELRETIVNGLRGRGYDL